MPNPLSKDELKIYLQTARHYKSTAGEFPFRVVPYTGLTLSEFLHLRPSWIYWGDGDALNSDQPPVIEIPHQDECRNHIWNREPPAMTTGTGPCRECKRSGETDDWEVRYPVHQRQIPIFDKIPRQALSRWFKTFERDGVGWTVSKLSRHIKRIAEESPLDRDLNYYNLRHTFVHICAEQGLPVRRILEITPHQRAWGPVWEIFNNSSTDYNLRTRTVDNLRLLKSIEPATQKEFCEETGLIQSSVSNFLRNCEDAGLVIKCGTKDSTTSGPDPAQYAVAPDFNIDDGIPCPAESCHRRFTSLKGRVAHLRQAH